MSDNRKINEDEKGNWNLKPARDLGLDSVSRMKSIARETGFFGNAIRSIWWIFVRSFLKNWNHFQIHGDENLPKNLPFVLIANHSSHLDVIVLSLSIPLSQRSKVFALAAEDHFFQDVSTSAFASLIINALPMTRTGGGKGRESIDFFRTRLTCDKIGLIIFPEGTRSRTGDLGAFRSGIGNLVAGTDIAVVPCFISGVHKAMPPDKSIIKRHPIAVYIGQPLTFKTVEQTKEGCESVAFQCQAAVKQLQQKANTAP